MQTFDIINGSPNAKIQKMYIRKKIPSYDFPTELQRVPAEIRLADKTIEKRQILATPKLPPKAPKLVCPVDVSEPVPLHKPMWGK